MEDPLVTYTRNKFSAYRHSGDEHPLLWYAKELLRLEEAAQHCGDHCRNTCLWCGLREGVKDIEAKRNVL